MVFGIRIRIRIRTKHESFRLHALVCFGAFQQWALLLLLLLLLSLSFLLDSSSLTLTHHVPFGSSSLRYCCM